MATSSIRFFGSPIATLPCPDSDPQPVCAASCFHRAVAWLPAPHSHPCHRTWLSRRRWYASTRPPLSPRLPPYAPPPTASAHQSSAPRCVCLATCASLLSPRLYSALCGFRGAGHDTNYFLLLKHSGN